MRDTLILTMAMIWEVVGGADKGGIIVREGSVPWLEMVGEFEPSQLESACPFMQETLDLILPDTIR